MKNRIKMNIACLWLIFFVAFLKNMLFIGLMYSSNADSVRGISNWFVIMVQLFIIALIFAPALFFRNKGKILYCIIIDTIFSILLILDIWYYRASWTLYSFKYLFFDGMFNVFNRSLINPCPVDLLFIIDLPVIYFILYKKLKNGSFKDNENTGRPVVIRIIEGVTAIALIIVFFVVTQYEVEVKQVGNGKYNLADTYWSPHAEIKEMGPLGFHFLEARKTMSKVSRKQNKTEIAKAEQWIKDNDENLPDNKYFGMFKGKNVIFLQLESYEAFVLNQKVNGQEITPTLNKLMKNSINFTNIYEQNNGGNSIDCDIMVNASMYTLGQSITGLTNEEVVFKGALPRILGKYGYTTAATKAEKGLDWNWGELHKNAFGVQNLWDEKTYKIDELVGFGLSDKSVFNQFIQKIKTLKQPFSAFTVTLTTHGPFDLNEELKELNLSKKLDENLLGKYFQAIHYSDKQLGKFVENLDKDGLLDNTVIVMYGDHGGVHKYYNDKIQDCGLEGDWWKPYDHKIPFMIYSKGFEGVNIDSYGGQTDFYPTIAYLLGIDKSEYQNYIMGRNLLNTKRTATIIKNNEIIGTPSSEAEKNHLLNAYDVGRIIIENNMFK